MDYRRWTGRCRATPLSEGVPSSGRNEVVEWANRSGMEVNVADTLLRVIDDPAPELEPLPGLD